MAICGPRRQAKVLYLDEATQRGDHENFLGHTAHSSWMDLRGDGRVDEMVDDKDGSVTKGPHALDELLTLMCETRNKRGTKRKAVTEYVANVFCFLWQMLIRRPGDFNQIMLATSNPS